MKHIKQPNNRLTVFLHIIIWIIVFILPAYLLIFDSGGDSHFYFVVFTQTFAQVIIFYLNYFWLVPKFFLKKRLVLYFLIISVIITAFAIGIGSKDFLFKKHPPHRFMENISVEIQNNDFIGGNNRDPLCPPPHDNMRMPPSKKWPMYNFFLISFLVSGFSIGLRFSEQHIKQEKRRKDAEKEKINSELMLLKNQISPHLFFNTLNNIYALMQNNTEDAQKAILQLSKLMRYMLYDSEIGDIKISKEIEFMQNYLELMKLRLSSKVELKISFPEKFPDVSIPPLLFIPFIENAFKHGVSYTDPSFIRINMKIDTSDILFSCSNSVYATSNKSDNQSPGIGLENVRKRLSLLFPETHTLSIDQSDASLYVVFLNIKL